MRIAILACILTLNIFVPGSAFADEATDLSADAAYKRDVELIKYSVKKTEPKNSYYEAFFSEIFNGPSPYADFRKFSRHDLFFRVLEQFPLEPAEQIAHNRSKDNPLKLELNEETQIAIDKNVEEPKNKTDTPTELAKAWSYAVPRYLLWVSYFGEGLQPAADANVDQEKLEKAASEARLRLRWLAGAELIRYMYRYYPGSWEALATNTAKRLFLSCNTTSNCYALLDVISIASEAMSPILLRSNGDQELVNGLKNSIAEIGKKDPFNGAVLDFRLQSLINQADFFDLTKITSATQQGVPVKISPEESNRLRQQISNTTGKNSYFRKAIEYARNRYISSLPEDKKADKMPSDFDLIRMIIARRIASRDDVMFSGMRDNTSVDEFGGFNFEQGKLSDAAFAKFKSNFEEYVDMMKFEFEATAVTAEENSTQQNQDTNPNQSKFDEEKRLKAKERMSVAHSFTSKLFQDFYSNVSLKYYLGRLQSVNATPFLAEINHAMTQPLAMIVDAGKPYTIEGDPSGQVYYYPSPIALYFTLAKFAKFEYTLETRSDWHNALTKMSQILTDYANNQLSDPTLISEEEWVAEENSRILTPKFIETLLDLNSRLKLKIENDNLDIARSFRIDEIYNKFKLKADDGRDPYVAVEKYQRQVLPYFKSYYHDSRTLLEAQIIFEHTAKKFRNSQTEENAEAMVNADDQWKFQRLLFSCNLYWLPVDKDGHIVLDLFQDQEKTRELLVSHEMLSQKPDWLTKLQFKDKNKVVFEEFDLRKVCGGDPDRVSESVLKYLNFEIMKGQSPDFGLNVAKMVPGIIADIAVIKLNSFASSWAYRKITGTELASTALNRLADKGRFSNFLATSLSTTLQAGLYVAVKKGFGEGVYQVNQLLGESRINWLREERFYTRHENAGWFKNFYMNYGHDFVFSWAVIGGLSHVDGFVNRSIYRRMSQKRVKIDNPNPDQINHYVRTGGRQKLVDYNGVTGLTKGPGIGVDEIWAYRAGSFLSRQIYFTGINVGLRATDSMLEIPTEAIFWSSWGQFWTEQGTNAAYNVAFMTSDSLLDRFRFRHLSTANGKRIALNSRTVLEREGLLIPGENVSAESLKRISDSINTLPRGKKTEGTVRAYYDLLDQFVEAGAVSPVISDGAKP